MNAYPLRLSKERVWLYGALLTALCLVQVRFVVGQGFGDWSAFWAAGATAGSDALLNAAPHAAWQSAHHVPTTIFPYLPAAAWLFAPFRGLPLAAGYALNFAIMALLATLAALQAARIYRISSGFALVATFAWAPVIAALSTGQNSPLGLLLTLYAIAGIVSGSEIAAGLATGALLYKLPYALPLLVILLFRRRYRACLIAGGCAIAGDMGSVAATAGDWQWPAHYIAALQGYFAADAQQNAVKAISVPALLMRLGITAAPSLAAGALLFLAAIPLFVRASLLEAASLAPLVALVAGPHTLPYDAALALPAIFYFVTSTSEPGRTRTIIAAYLLAPLWLLSGILRFDILAILCDVPVFAWFLKGYHESTSRPHLGIADSRDRSQA